TANRPWPTWHRSAASLLRVGQRAARSPERWPADLPRGAWFFIGSRPSTRAQGRAPPSLLLSNREQEWTPRRATLLCSPPFRSFAQALPGLWITLSSARPFLRSAQLGYSA